MSRYIYLKDSPIWPLTQQELVFVDQYRILSSSRYQIDLLSSLDTTNLNRLLLKKSTHDYPNYPRFTPDRSFLYKISPNPKLLVMPDDLQAVCTVTAFNNRALELYKKSEFFENVYVFWSGGIDSTAILSAILQTWPDTKKLKVVLNHFSIAENQCFYDKYIRFNLETISTDLFFDKLIRFDHQNLYVTGDLGDSTITFTGYDEFEFRHPGLLNKSWRSNIDAIVDYLSHNSNQDLAKATFIEIVESARQAKIELETVHDFFWWVGFNWAYSLEISFFLWQYQDFDNSIDVKQFQEENIFYWFNSVEFQNWALSLIGSELRACDGICKYAFKKYIYDFDKNRDYFKHKIKEDSTPKNIRMFKNKRILAIDKNYNIYYR
jgi:hypothetical protein